MNTKSTIAIVLSVGALVMGGAAFIGQPIQVNVPAQEAPVVNVPKLDQPTVVVEPAAVRVNNIPSAPVATPTPAPILGALTGPDLYVPYFNLNGSVTYKERVPMRTATTTLCAIKAPAATSTLRYASFVINVGTSTAATIDLATSTTAYATTTNLVSAKSIGSGARGHAAWTPTGGSTNDATVAPNEYVVVKTAGAGLGGYTYGGYCTAEFQAI